MPVTRSRSSSRLDELPCPRCSAEQRHAALEPLLDFDMGKPRVDLIKAAALAADLEDEAKISAPSRRRQRL